MSNQISTSYSLTTGDTHTRQRRASLSSLCHQLLIQIPRRLQIQPHLRSRPSTFNSPRITVRDADLHQEPALTRPVYALHAGELEQFVAVNRSKPINFTVAFNIPEGTTMQDACNRPGIPVRILRFPDLKGDRWVFAKFCAAKALLEPHMHPEVDPNLLRRYWNC
jgi:hypothetical protein